MPLLCQGQIALAENLHGAVGSTWSALLEARPPSHLLRCVLHQPSMGIIREPLEKYIVNIRKRLPSFPAVNDSGYVN